MAPCSSFTFNSSSQPRASVSVNKLAFLTLAGAMLAVHNTVETLAFLDIPKRALSVSTSHGPFERSFQTQTKRQSWRSRWLSSASSPQSSHTKAKTTATETTSETKAEITTTRIVEEKDDGVTVEEQMSLTFSGEVTFDSNALPHPESPEVLSRFFQTPQFWNLLVTGGGERPCTELELTPQVFDDWTSKCQMLGACLPEQGTDSVVSITTPGLSFPGLTVKNIATVGTKYVEATPPRHEFVLLSSESKASGLPPVVWLYNKLTGNADAGGETTSRQIMSGPTSVTSSDDGSSSSSSTNIKSLSTVSYQRKDDRVVFTTNASLSIGMKFPKLLMKALGDKRKAEEVGANSIRKTLVKDVAQSMQAFEKAYLSYLDEQ